MPLHDYMLPNFERVTRNGCIIRAYRAYQWWSQEGELPSYSSLMKLSDLEIEKINLKLPYPLPFSHSIIDAVMQTVRDNSDFLKFIMAHREDLNEVIRQEEKQKLYLLDMIDAASCALHPILLCSDNTELMVMEADLAEKSFVLHKVVRV
jgi:hypothetical protein